MIPQPLRQFNVKFHRKLLTITKSTLGGVDRHDQFCSTFSLGKAHGFKKYYVKLLLFIMDVALTNDWVYYSMVSPEETKQENARADFFLSIATEKISQDIDWAGKYNARQTTHQSRRGERRGGGDDSDGSDSMELLMPPTTAVNPELQPDATEFLRMIRCEECIPIPISDIPFELKKRSRNCQICNYEMQKQNWKNVHFCSKHGVRLCLQSSPARADVKNPL